MISVAEIKEAAIDSTTHLPDLLRKCQVLAFELGNEDFKNWVTYELNGYPEGSTIPEYRVISVQSYGHCNNIAWKHDHAPVALDAVEGKHRDFLSQHQFVGSVASLASIVKDKRGGEALSVAWPHSFLMYYSNKILSDFYFTSIWKEIAASQIVEVLDTIRNRILRFALELEKESPDIEERANTIVEQTRVQQIFNTYITGEAANVNVGGTKQVTYNVDVMVNCGDFESLKEYLLANGVPKGDIDDLEAAIQEDERDKSQNGFGERVDEWFSNMTRKALSGAWDVAAPTAAAFITYGMMRYFGM